MNQYVLYEWLKSEFIEKGIIYDMQHVKAKYKNGLSDKAIIDGYVDFYYYALSNLQNIYGIRSRCTNLICVKEQMQKE